MVLYGIYKVFVTSHTVYDTVWGAQGCTDDEVLLMCMDSQKSMEAGVSRGYLDRKPFEWVNLYQRTNVSNVQQQILTLHPLYDLIVTRIPNML